MSLPQEFKALSKAFSGHGIDEKSLISILGKSKPENRKALRKGTPHLFVEDERQFEKWDDRRLQLLKNEFMRFKKAVVLWAMHPWERDARLANEVLKNTQAYEVLIEVACTRSSEELLGARKAYHSLFEHSIEEDVISLVHARELKILIALLSAYRYEGSEVKDGTAKSEAKTLSDAIKNANNKPMMQDDEVIRILGTRSKPHLQAIYKHYKQIKGKNIDEVLDAALRIDGNENAKKGLTRVILTRADTDMKAIKDEYQCLYGVSLSQKIEDTANGNYKDFLLTLIGRED